jgi:uncharacterized protein YbjT (DUF2867 family)
MQKTIAIFGATGMLGMPVCQTLANAGFTCQVLVRDKKLSEPLLPKSCKIIEGDLINIDHISQTLTGASEVYLNLSVGYNEKQSDFHPEEQGLEAILKVAREMGIKRVIYLSSLIIRYPEYQDWWVFQLKNKAIKTIKNSGIPYTIFYPSMFLDTIPARQIKGNSIPTAGKGKQKIHPIAAADYAQMVLRSLQIELPNNAEFVVQGKESLYPEEMIEIFVANYPHAKLKVQNAPIGLLKFIGLFKRDINFLTKIIDSINNMPEPFEGNAAWEQLAKPQLDTVSFAKNCRAKSS